MLRKCSIVEPTIISAPTSTKTEKGERDPEMYQIKVGNQRHFGMKVHIHVDDTLGLIHRIDTTATNNRDIAPTGNPLLGEGHRVFDDTGYLGIQKRDEHKERKYVSWFLVKLPCSRKELETG